MLKNESLLNPELVGALARAGHGDVVVVADAGLPIPSGPQVVDVSLVPGTPSFVLAAAAVIRALHVESAVRAEEAGATPARDLIAAVVGDLPTTVVPHEDFKAMVRTASLVLRTGECTPYANLALVAGTSF